MPKLHKSICLEPVKLLYTAKGTLQDETILMGAWYNPKPKSPSRKRKQACHRKAVMQSSRKQGQGPREAGLFLQASGSSSDIPRGKMLSQYFLFNHLFERQRQTKRAFPLAGSLSNCCNNWDWARLKLGHWNHRLLLPRKLHLRVKAGLEPKHLDIECRGAKWYLKLLYQMLVPNTHFGLMRLTLDSRHLPPCNLPCLKKKT